MASRTRSSNLALVAAFVLAGCGGSHRAASTTLAAKPAPAPRPIGVVGPLAVDVVSSVKRRVSLADIAGSRLVLVSARSAGPAEVAAAAAGHPDAHFALVGASVAGFRRPNLVGVVLRAAQAAWLGGVAAGLVLTDDGGSRASAAWVGPQEPYLTAEFARGVHSVAPGATVLRAVSGPKAARCKEAALGVLARGAVVVMAHGGLCAAAAAAAAHDAARPGLELADFELPSAAATVVAREALGGLYHGGEDIVFDAGSGAIGINRLDHAIPPAVAAKIGAVAQQLLKSSVANRG
jgi:hypothetical protein